MNFDKTFIASSVAAMSLALVGCGSDSQDSSASSNTSFTGLVLDGRVANATVWIDLNDNGALDSFEPYANTDEAGYFSYNPETDTHYCDMTDSPYCLSSAAVQTSAKIKIAGGTDLDSGERFYGVMTQTVTKAQAQEYEAGTAVPMLSPLTSLGASLTDEQLVTLLTSLGISVDMSTLDSVLATDFSDREDLTSAEASSKESLFKAAYRVQKIVDAIAVILDAAASEAGLSLGVTSDNEPGVRSTSEFVIAALTEALNGDVATISARDLDSLSASDLATITELALDKFAAQYAALDDSLSESQVKAEFESVSRDDVGQVASDVGTTVKDVTDGVDFSDGTNLAKNFKKSVIKAETLLAQTKSRSQEIADGTVGAKTSVATVAANVKSGNFDNALEATLGSASNVDDVTLDVGLLAAKVAGQTTSSDYSAVVSDATLAPVSQNLWSKHFLSMSGMSNSGGNITERGRVMFFFDGESESATKGDVSVCYAFDSGVGSSDDDEIGSIQGATWSQVSDGVIQVTTDFGSFQIKAYRVAAIAAADVGNYLGLVTPGAPGSGDYGKFLFSSEAFDQDATWYSDFSGDAADTSYTGWGLRSATSIPTSDDACKTFDFTDGGTTYNDILTMNLTITE